MPRAGRLDSGKAWLRRIALRAQKALLASTTQVGRRALRYGTAPSLVHRSILKHLQPVCVIDVGANRGQFALDLMSACPDAELLCIEPIPAAATVLAKISRHTPRATVMCTALGSSCGSTELHVSRSDDNSSLRYPTDLQTSMFSESRTVRTTRVAVCTLDSVLAGRVIPSASLLKIDVQGSEMEVLLGASESLQQFTWLYIECSAVELYTGQALLDHIVVYLHRKGFILSDVRNALTRQSELIQADVVFTQALPESDALV